MCFYYGASQITSGGTEMDYRTCAGLARARLDGYTCLRVRASSLNGVLTTVPFQVTEPMRLVINTACDRDNAVRVEVRDPAGEVLPGYEREEYIPITTDQVYAWVAWQQKAQIGPHARVCLRFYVEGRQARLYAFGLEKECS